MSPNGLILTYGTYGAAYQARHSMYRARLVDREMNKRALGSDEPLHNRSYYDQLIIRLRKLPDGTAELHIEKQDSPSLRPISTREIA